MLFTSESVTSGHPAKIADQISDAVLDAVLERDAQGRVACETLVKDGLVVLAGEISAAEQPDLPGIVRSVVKRIGYGDPRWGFNVDVCEIRCAVSRQSPDIAQGVDRDGAGDQGMMFGYACRETECLMPAPITYAHALTRGLDELRRSGRLDYDLGPDGKAQVTVEYAGRDGTVARIDTVVVSTMHEKGVDQKRIRADIEERLIRAVLPRNLLDERTVIHVNPTGCFEIGGPAADAGVTGRKIIVDTYGGMGRHGGGAFSGKDPTKVDRSAAYMARCIAKNVVAAELAERCEVQLAYAIGRADPVSVYVKTFGTAQAPEERIEAAIREVFPLTPRGIICDLDLLRPIYRKTAVYGHFGRTGSEFTWERTDRAEALRKAVG